MAAFGEQTSSSSFPSPSASSASSQLPSIRVMAPSLETRIASLCSTSIEDAQKRGELFSLEDLQAMAKSLKIHTSQSKSNLITAIRKKKSLQESPSKTLNSQATVEEGREP